MAGGLTRGQFQEGINLGGGGINFSKIGDMDSAKLDDILTGKSSVWGVSGSAGGLKALDDINPMTGTKTFQFTNNATAGSSSLDWFKIEEVIDDAYHGKVHEFSVQYQNEYSTSAVKFIMKAKTSGEVLYEEYLPTFIPDSNEGEELVFRFKVPKDGLVDWGCHILNGESSKKIRLDDVVITPILREIQETVFIEEADSMVRLHTANGYGSTANKIRRFATLVDKIGSAITYTDSATDGASFIIEEDGVYNISFSESQVSDQEYVGLSVNAPSLTAAIETVAYPTRLALSRASGTMADVSWSGYLKKAT